MHAKLLFLSTIGLAVASPWALADETPVTRSAVIADYQQAARAGKLHRTDWDDELAARPASGSQITREQVVAGLKSPTDPRLVGPLRSRTYNPFGTELMGDPVYTRDEVKAGVLQARAENTLRPAGEAGDQYVAASPRREAPGFLAGRLRRSGS